MIFSVDVRFYRSKTDNSINPKPLIVYH